MSTCARYLEVAHCCYGPRVLVTPPELARIVEHVWHKILAQGTSGLSSLTGAMVTPDSKRAWPCT